MDGERHCLPSMHRYTGGCICRPAAVWSYYYQDMEDRFAKLEAKITSLVLLINKQQVGLFGEAAKENVKMFLQ